jgi:hypothetical protein
MKKKYKVCLFAECNNLISDASSKKYCSKRCRQLQNNLKRRNQREQERGKINCIICGKNFTPLRSDTRCCSKSCSDKNWRQENDVRNKELDRIYYRKNSIIIRSKAKDWVEKNPEKTKATQSVYYIKNRKKILDYQKEYAKTNKDTIRQYKRQWQRNFRELNQDEIAKKRTKYRSKENVRNRELANQKRRRKSFGIKGRINHNISTSIRNCLKGNKKGRKWEEIVGYTLDELISHLEKQFDDKMTWQNYGRKNDPHGWEIDHRVPQSWFNYSSYEDKEFKECWALKNLQPKWMLENISKNNRYSD